MLACSAHWRIAKAAAKKGGRMKQKVRGGKKAVRAQIRRLLESGRLSEAQGLAADHGFVIHQDGERFEIYLATAREGRK